MMALDNDFGVSYTLKHIFSSDKGMISETTESPHLSKTTFSMLSVEFLAHATPREGHY